MCRRAATPGSPTLDVDATLPFPQPAGRHPVSALPFALHLTADPRLSVLTGLGQRVHLHWRRDAAPMTLPGTRHYQQTLQRLTQLNDEVLALHGTRAYLRVIEYDDVRADEIFHLDLYQLTGAADPSGLTRAVEEVIAREHPAARCRVTSVQADPLHPAYAQYPEGAYRVRPTWGPADE